MKRKSIFFVTILSAALTFGGLVAFVGPPRWHTHCHHMRQMEKCDSDQPAGHQDALPK